MRLLADENFPREVVEWFRAAGHDVLWARTNLPGYSDSELLDHAENQGRMLITLDKDFWQIAVQRRKPLVRAGVILFRTHPATPANVLRLARMFVEADLDWAGHISVVTADGVQMVRSARG